MGARSTTVGQVAGRIASHGAEALDVSLVGAGTTGDFKWRARRFRRSRAKWHFVPGECDPLGS
jgi:hypothetical protein